MATYWSSGNVVFVERMVTTWYLAIHIGFIFMALGLDVVNLLLDKSSKIARSFTAFNNLIFISVVFPFGLFVPLTYWSLFFYNYNLILPNIVEITVPNWVSTSSHSVISLVALLEMITTKYTYKGNYILALTMMTVFSASYITCLIGTYVQFGFWVYPVLHLVPEEELWMVFLALAAKLVALFFFGAGVSFLIHGVKPGKDRDN
ncbi:androgen-dependent TFPI-regulating protein-like [Planococcus citri]|uniref:androgen-dependent TFPI-regulating protein-like n=1 Tax=Planococcus citri TaxID=170843 RepID=UPI0031F7FE65